METIYWWLKSKGNLFSNSGVLAQSPRRWQSISSQRGTLYKLLLMVAMAIALTSYAAAMPGSADASDKSTRSPNVASVTRSSGVVGTAVTIFGANFGATQGTSTVRFGGVKVAPTNRSGLSIVAPVPAAAMAGIVAVTVHSQAANDLNFELIRLPPSITSLSPSSGVVGTAVRITGANFGTTQGTSTV